MLAKETTQAVLTHMHYIKVLFASLVITIIDHKDYSFKS